MKLSILYDNTTQRGDMKADWGFSALVERDGETILFDTGAEWEILKANMDSMGMDLGSIDRIVISHDHWDHNGGLAGILDEIDVPVHIPSSFETDVESDEIVVESQPGKICEGFHTTGELGGIEQSMAVDIRDGLFLVVGCSHPGLGRILDEVSKMGNVVGVAGGFHGFSDLKRLEKLQMVVPTHCTQKIEEIKKLYPEKYIEGGAGCVIEMDS